MSSTDKSFNEEELRDIGKFLRFTYSLPSNTSTLKYNSDDKLGLRGACKGGHLNMVKLINQKPDM